MALKAAVSALVLALPILSVNGSFDLHKLYSGLGLIYLAALRTKRSLCPDGVHTVTNQACCALFPVVEDLTANLFENECGDAVSVSLRILSNGHLT